MTSEASIAQRQRISAMAKYRKRFTVVFISRVIGIEVRSDAKDFHLKSQAQDCLERLKVMFKTTYISGYIRTNGKERAE